MYYEQQVNHAHTQIDSGTIRELPYFNIKKVVKITKIIKGKISIKNFDQRFNQLRINASVNNIIIIFKHIQNILRRMLEK